jgi:YVTN family beta-propeller protein
MKRRLSRRLFTTVSLLAACGGPVAQSPDGGGSPDKGQPVVSRALALSADGKELWVVNPDSDSVSVIDTASRSLVQEILLTGTRPTLDPTTMRYDPPVMPRALAIDDVVGKVYVTGEMSSQVYVLDETAKTVKTSFAVGAEPTAVVASPDGRTVYVVSHQAALVSKIDTATDQVVAMLSVQQFPWGASLRADGSALYVTHFLTQPAVTTIDTASFTVRSVSALADQPADPAGNTKIPNGKVRGAYAVVPRPDTGELWVPHLLLAVGTFQTPADPAPPSALQFDNTVFPTISRLPAGGGTTTSRVLFQPLGAVGFTGNFTDSCSGPRDVAFTPDGKLALLALGQSEDVMVFDATTGDEVQLVRPLSKGTNFASMLEGIVVDATGTTAYVSGRNSHNVAVLTIAQSAGGPNVQVADFVDTLMTDPMPTNLRQGQRLFYSANSADFPITQNFWVACSSCHLEGRSDAVTWIFEQGPRDTPSNVGGPINTGFLFRQATRNTVVQYDATIRKEQGGAFDRTDVAQLPQLQALSDYVNYAIPLPPNPNAPGSGGLTTAEAHGKTLFDASCGSCHAGPFFTDSGSGNPTLDFNGTVVLHDTSSIGLGTCVTTGPTPDVSAMDDNTPPDTRMPCDFDTPTLRGIFASPPYFHDGSAATLGDVVARLPQSKNLSASDQSDLVSYLQTL